MKRIGDLPDIGDEPIPELAETIQHGIYRGFIAPVALYAALGAVLYRNRQRQSGGDDGGAGPGDGDGRGPGADGGGRGVPRAVRAGEVDR